MERRLHQINLQPLPHNVQAQHRKEPDVKIEPRIQVVAVIITSNQEIKYLGDMNKNFLFAIDINTEEVIVSDSSKGSNKVNFIERIKKSDNEMFFNAVLTLTSITKSPSFDAIIFKSMDKVCQIMYNKNKETI
jgi:hypothetical protein